MKSLCWSIMRFLTLIIVFCLFYSVCFGQNKQEIIESDEAIFQQSVDKLPDLFDSADWNLIYRKSLDAYEKQNYSRALNYSLKAKILAEKLQDKLLLAKSFHQIGKSEGQLHDRVKANEAFQGAIRNIKAGGKTIENKLELGFLINDWAYIYSNPAYINSQKDLNTALSYLLQIYNAVISNDDPQFANLRIETFLNISSCFGQKGYALAQIIWLEKIKSEIAGNKNVDQPHLFNTYFGLQAAYRKIGDYDISSKYLKEIEILLQKTSNDNTSLLYLSNLSEFYTQTSRAKQRNKVLDDGISLGKKLNNLNQLGKFYTSKMLTSLEDNRIDDAKKYLALVEALFSQDKFLANDLDILITKAVIAAYESNAEKSAENFQLADKYLDENGREETNNLKLLAWKSKIALYQQNYEQFKNINEKYLNVALKSNSKDSLPLIYINLAKAQFELGDLKEAQRNNQKAIDLIETKRLSSSAMISVRVIEGLYEAYQLSVLISLKTDNFADGFMSSETLKARWLRDKITPNFLFKKVTIDEKIKSEIFDNSIKLLQKPDSEEIAVRLSALEKSSIFYEENNLNNLISRDANKNLLRELEKSAIDKETAVISYVFVNDQHLAAFVWQRGMPLQARYLPITKQEIDAMAVDVSDKMKNFVFFKQDGKQIYDKLLQPLLVNAHHLIIIPDKSLWKIPFQALSNDGKNYLIENKLITYAPSVSILLEQLKHPKPNRQSFQVFANAVYGNLYLKYVNSEAKDLAKMFSSSPLLNASAAQFITLADKSDIVHFSMHSAVDNDEPFNSFLAFNKTDKSSGRITVDDFSEIHLKRGSLAFLASCNTDNVISGEGIISLAWGMMGAGATTVISAQWEANDKATGIFTKSFYKYYRQGFTSANAMQKASLDMINSRVRNINEPYYWAEFTLNGDYR